VYLQWLEKAAEQDNPDAIYWLAEWNYFVEQDEQAFKDLDRAAASGWKSAIKGLANILRTGDGCEANVAAAVFLCARGNLQWFWEILREVVEKKLRGVDYHPIYYALGWGMYWYMDGSEELKIQRKKDAEYGNRCMRFYCSKLELQQRSIFTFLLCWNQATGGVKDIGWMTAQMVWEGRETNLVNVN
jgi:hypothetical protein